MSSSLPRCRPRDSSRFTPLTDAHPLGECIDPPTECPAASAPVCGCDGQTYGNACEAAKARASVLREGACEQPEAPELATCGGPSQPLCPEGTFCELETGSPAISSSRSCAIGARQT